MNDLLILMNVINAMAKGHALDQQTRVELERKIVDLERKIAELEKHPPAA